MSADEVTLVANAQAGDTEAFGRLIKRHSPRIFQVAFRITRNEATADDVVQEASIRAYRKLDRFDGRAAFGTWLYRIAVNCAMDAMRKRQRNRETDPLDDATNARQPTTSDPGPQRLAMSREISTTIEAVLQGMTPMERTAFVLKHFEGRPLIEISEVMDIRVNAVKHAIFRAVQKLRSELGPLTRGHYETA
jgi:RNA polymerase sigma-70 factor (ECF subfamily)